MRTVRTVKQRRHVLVELVELDLRSPSGRPLPF
jgi:hypothetical protein